MASVSSIKKSLEALGIQLTGIDDEELEIFQWLKENAMYRSNDRRTHMSRFGAAPHSLIKALKLWGIDDFEVTYCNIEFDFLSSRKLFQAIDGKKLKAEAAKVGAGHDDKEPLATPGLDEMLIRSVSRNAPVVSFQMQFVL